MKLSASVPAIAGAFLAGLLIGPFWRGPDPDLLASADSLAKAAATADSLRKVASRADSLTDSLAAELLARDVSHRQRAASLGRAAAHLTDTLRLLVTDSAALATLDSLDAFHAAQVAALDSARTDAEARAELFRGRWLAYRDTLMPEILSQRDRAQQLLEQAIKQSRAPRRCGPGASLGYTLSTAGTGWGGTIGLSCRL